MYGGVSIDDQTRELKRGVDLFVGTCGRVLDHIERGNIDFSDIKSVFLDEADQMLKLGFKEDVEKVRTNFVTLSRYSVSSETSQRKTCRFVCFLLRFQNG